MLLGGVSLSENYHMSIYIAVDFEMLMLHIYVLYQYLVSNPCNNGLLINEFNALAVPNIEITEMVSRTF